MGNGMRINITKGLILAAKATTQDFEQEILFPAGEYNLQFTPDGKIEIANSKKVKALFSFSQFREKVSLGEFVVIDM